ncbi:MAG: MFS transporter [Acidobacteriota bacterium]
MKLYYGWRVVAALFVMLMCSSGLGFYNQSVLLEALTQERGFTVAQVSLATTLFFGVSSLTGLLVASLLQRFDARWTIVVGTMIAALALALIGRAQGLLQVYAVFALFGIGFSGSSMIGATTLVTRWFEARRGAALAVTTTGLSVGGIVLTPLSARWIGELGLERGGLRVAALYLLGVLPFVLLLVRDRPSDLGLEPDGRAPGAVPVDDSVPFADAVGSRFFRCLVMAYLLAMLAQVGGIAHQFKLVGDAADAALAARCVSALAGGSIVGRLVSGWLAGRVGVRGLSIFLLSAQGAALTLLGQAESPAALVAASVLFGLTVGSVLLMQPLLMAAGFGVRDYPRIFSVGSLISGVGVSFGALLIGVLHDSFGGYGTAFAVAGSLSFASAVVLLSAGSVAGPRRKLAEASDRSPSHTAQ